jgi:hypothetical protein
MTKLVIIGVNEEGFQMLGPPPDNMEQATALIQYHDERLRALIDKPVLLCVSWENGDHEAVVTIMPADGKPPENDETGDKPFEKFTLPIPRAIRRISD